MQQVALVHVLAATQPGPAHAAAVEAVGERALDDLGAELEGFAGDPGQEPRPIVGDRAARRLVAAPAGKAGLLGLGDPRLPGGISARQP